MYLVSVGEEGLEHATFHDRPFIHGYVAGFYGRCRLPPQHAGEYPGVFHVHFERIGTFHLRQGFAGFPYVVAQVHKSRSGEPIECGTVLPSTCSAFFLYILVNKGFVFFGKLGRYGVQTCQYFQLILLVGVPERILPYDVVYRGQYVPDFVVVFRVYVFLYGGGHSAYCKEFSEISGYGESDGGVYLGSGIHPMTEFRSEFFLYSHRPEEFFEIHGFHLHHFNIAHGR